MVDGGPLLGAALQEVIFRRENCIWRRHGDRLTTGYKRSRRAEYDGRRLRHAGPGDGNVRRSESYRVLALAQRNSLIKLDVGAKGYIRNSDEEERWTLITVVIPASQFGKSMTVLSEILIALLKLSAIPVRIGLISAEVAVLRLGGSLAKAGSEEPVRPLIDEEVDAAAQVIEASLTDGRDIGFRNMLRINFPEEAIREMAEAALKAARDKTRRPVEAVRRAHQSDR